MSRRSRAYRYLKRLQSEIPETLQIILLTLPTLGALIGWQIENGPGTESTRTILSTLAGGQAAILAIVFSVSVIGMQLVGQRYSPRLIVLFVESPIFVFTFALFLVSMGLNILLLFIQPGSPSAFYTAALVGTVGFALTAMLSLYFFVKGAVQASTPEGVIDSFVSAMTTDKYLHSVRESAEDSSERAHPFRPLYTLIMNTVSRGEFVAAERGLGEYSELAETTMAELDERGIFAESDSDDERFENESPDVIRGLFGPVCKDHLKDMSLHAANHEEYSIAQTAIESQFEIGKRGLELPIDSVSYQAQQGLSRTILESSIDSGTKEANYHAWKNQAKLLKNAAKKPHPSIIRAISSSIRNDVERQLRDVSEARKHQRAMTELFVGMKDAHCSLLTNYGEEINGAELDWHCGHVPDNAPNREALEAVHQFRSALIETTEYFLRVSIELGERPVRNWDFRHSWMQICVDASRSNAEDYAISLCQVLIEIAFIELMEFEEAGWHKIIADLKDEGDSEIVDAAFERLKEYEHVDPDSVVRVGSIEIDPNDTHYPNSISIKEYVPLNAQIGYSETIDEMQEMVEEEL